MVYLGLTDQSLECPGCKRKPTLEKIEKYLLRTKKLPTPCQDCFTVIVWRGKGELNIAQFIKMLNECYYERIDKNRQYQRVYFRILGEENKEKFIEELNQNLKEYQVEAHIDWRRCCKWIEEKFPSFFKNSKEFSEGMQLKMF